MKFFTYGIIPAALFLVACGTYNPPTGSYGDFDPTQVPGSGINSADTSYGPTITPGPFVTANIPNTAFYKDKPKGSEDADKLLSLGSNMKIVSNDGSYVKVELDSGEVGWVPSVMVSSSATDLAPIDGAYQVYPPLPVGGALEPLPTMDANDQPPGGSIPTIIDPNAPIPAPPAPLIVDPLPNLTPSTPEATENAPKDASEEKPTEEKPAE